MDPIYVKNKTDHRGPGHLRAPIDGVGHSSSEAMVEEPQVPFGA